LQVWGGKIKKANQTVIRIKVVNLAGETGTLQGSFGVLWEQRRLDLSLEGGHFAS